MSEEISEAAFARMVDGLVRLGETFIQTGMSAVELASRLQMVARDFVEMHFLDEPMPGEEPVDFVLRVGARSGYFIYPDEAWRYRANLDWWNEGKESNGD